MIKNSISLLVMSVLIFSTAAFAETPPPRTINVFGSAQVNVVPDEVQVLMGVGSWDPVLKNARDKNDAVVKKVLETAKGFKIEPPPRYVQTDYIEVNPEYDDITDPSTRVFIERKIKDYKVRKSIGVIFKDVVQSEDFCKSMFGCGPQLHP